MSDIVVFDSSVLIDNQRTARHSQRMASVTGLVRLSSVVMAELWRGATEPAEQEFLRTLEKNLPILTPTEKNWLESGEILARMRPEMRTDQGFKPARAF